MKLVWITDLHLDHLTEKDPGALRRLRQAIDAEGVTHILLGGDIAESRTLETRLKCFLDATERPVFYVLGNHDYYFGSVSDVRRRAAALKLPGLRWLPDTGIIDLGEGTALVGNGGWGDARQGDMKDFIILTDYAAIKELAETIDHEDFWVNGFKKRDKLIDKLGGLGAEAADTLKKHLLEAVQSYRRVLILTHVTPFEQTCTYNDKPGTAQGFPGFLWHTMGPVIRSAAEKYPDTEIFIYSGHTHQESTARISANIRAWSASAEYGELSYRVILPDFTPGPSIMV